MPDRWTTTPSGRVVRAPRPGSGPAASILSGVFVFLLFAVVLLVAVAVLLPDRWAGGGSVAGGARQDASASPVPAGAPLPARLPMVILPPTRTVASPATGAAMTPTPSPAPATPSARSASTETTVLRRAAPLVVEGRRIGRVTVQAVRGVTVPGLDLPDDRRVVAATVRLVAAARLRYDQARWRLEDGDGRRWPASSGTDAGPPDLLGTGTLQPRQNRVGAVAFVIPKGTAWRRIILTDGDGTDLVAVERPGPAS